MSALATTLPPMVGQDPSTNIQFLNNDSITTYCETRRSILKKDEETIELAQEDLMRRQQQVMLQGLLKLTKDVKKLSVKEFDDAFGCDVIDMIKKVMVDGGVNSSGKKRVRHVGGGAAATTTGVAAVGGLNLKTPAHRFGKGVPATRTARRGEKIVSYSENGSPIEQFDQGEVVITAKKLRTNKGITPLPVTIGIGAGNGECIDLSDPDQRKKLGEDQKAQAMQQLMAMQEQMKNLMADW